MSFWDTVDARPVDVHEGYKHLAPSTNAEREAPPPSPRAHGPVPRCSQNDLRGVCDYCRCERDDVLLGVCADCEEVDRARP